MPDDINEGPARDFVPYPYPASLPERTATPGEPLPPVPHTCEGPCECVELEAATQPTAESVAAGLDAIREKAHNRTAPGADRLCMKCAHVNSDHGDTGCTRTIGPGRLCTCKLTWSAPVPLPEPAPLPTRAEVLEVADVALDRVLAAVGKSRTPIGADELAAKAIDALHAAGMLPWREET